MNNLTIYSNWISVDDDFGGYLQCSECGYENHDYVRYNYCPNCGARMDGTNMMDYKVGELIIYINGDRCEIGKIKRLCDDGAFVWYHNGYTASKTPYECMHKIINAYCIRETDLGGEVGGEY